MRLELQFELMKNELPLDNKRIWISFLKNVITNCNEGKFYERYFTNSVYKDYTFSIILPRPQFLKERILLEGTSIKMMFSADDRNKTGFIFYSAFINVLKKKYPLPEGNAMVLKEIRQIREQVIRSSKVIFQTVTGGGLVIRDHNSANNKDCYFTFEEECFVEALKRVSKIQALEAGFSECETETLNFTPLQCKKVLVKHYGVYVDTTIGTFEMEGSSDLLQYFYQAGLGSRHSAGFGMLDIVNQDFA